MTKKSFILSPLTGLFAFVFAYAQPATTISPDLVSIPNSLQFYVIGDWGRKGEPLANAAEVINEESLARAMDQVGTVIEPRFIISTGDNFYPNGVKSDSDPRWKETFEDIYNGKNMQCRWYIVLGNHDHRGNVKGEIDYSKRAGSRWYLPSNYYSEVTTLPDGSRAKFIFIDTTPFVKGDDRPQLKWLAAELAENSYDWKFVVGHHPLYSGNSRLIEQKHLRDAIENLLIQNNVNVYLCGHDHNLQYLKKGKINYLISGAGSEIYTSNPIKDLTRFIYCKVGMQCTSAFMVFSLTRSQLYVQMIDSRGQLLYRSSITK
jgi:tartrate-resistant acid phosphatase type 5